ncbi:flagellar basal body-associated protein FliL [Polaromonas sp.]|uniref:flagellar basal body-associated protein FliL n=1 Tax=Polaromonas sp. TaxID=1869339 RepID=UPI003567D605
MATTNVPVPPPEIPPAGRKRRLILIVLLILVVAAGAAGAGYYYFYLRGSKEAAIAVKPPEIPIFIALEPFTVNLQPNSRSRFLHVAVTLKVSNIKSQAQLVQYLPEVRSRVLTTLSNRTAESLLTTEEKDVLAAEILSVLKQPFAVNLLPAGISSVMFTTFMLQ